jgi:phage-related minor tail protein
MNYAERILQIREEYANKEYEIKMLANNQVLTLDEEAKALERNNELRQRSIDQAKEVLTETRRQTEGTFTEGVGKAFNDYIKNIPTQLQLGQQAFTAVIGNMDMALQNFVRSGKFNFKDFANSVIQDMLMIQARAQMMSMMKGIFSMFGGGSGSISLSETPVGGTSMTGFADGGDPPVGRASIVGERGPELFVPRTAGTIIPNNQLAGAMGGSTVNYNGPYIASMSAIDTQTGVQFLAKNKQTIWASYQSANRSVPVSR